MFVRPFVTGQCQRCPPFAPSADATLFPTAPPCRSPAEDRLNIRQEMPCASRLDRSLLSDKLSQKSSAAQAAQAGPLAPGAISKLSPSYWGQPAIHKIKVGFQARVNNMISAAALH